MCIRDSDEPVVKRVEKIAEHDWTHSHPLDLSDEGFLAEFEKDQAEVAEMLAIDTSKANHGHHHEHKTNHKA